MSAARIPARVSASVRSTALQAGSTSSCTHSGSGSAAHHWLRLIVQMRTLSCATRPPVKQRTRCLLGQRPIHSNNTTRRATAATSKTATSKSKTAASDSWNIPLAPRSATTWHTGQSPQLPWRGGSRATGEGAIKSTTVFYPPPEEISAFIPDASSQNPDTDYWKLYQKQLDQKKPITDTDLLRLFDWLRSKPLNKDLAKKLTMIIAELRKFSVQFSSDVYNDFIHFHLLRGKYEEAQAAIDALVPERRDMATSQRTLALRMAMYLKSGNETALKELIERQGSGLMQYMAQFLSWTKGIQLTNDHIQRVKTIFHDLQTQSCPPNSRRFTHLLNTLFAKDRPEEAVALLNHTLDIGFKANEYTGTCIISGLLRTRRYEDALQVWNRLMGQEAAPRLGLPIMNSVLSAFSQEPNQFPAAVKLWEVMLQDPDIKPDVYSFSSMLNGYFRERDPISAAVLWEVMQKVPYSITPNWILYNTMLTGLFHNHKPEDAKAIYEEMLSRKDVEVPLDTYQIMIKGLLSIQDQKGLDEVMARMEKSGIEPDTATYTLITDTIFSQRDAKSALKIVELMTSRGVPKTAITYSAIVAGLVKVGKFEEAKAVYEDMKTAGHQPTIHTYGAMISGALKSGDVKLAEEMAGLARSKVKEGLSSGTYAILIAGYARLSMMDQAEKWLMELEKTTTASNMGEQIHWRNYFVMLKACVEQGTWASAERVLEVMRKSNFESMIPKLNSLIQEVERVRQGGAPHDVLRRTAFTRHKPPGASNRRK